MKELSEKQQEILNSLPDLSISRIAFLVRVDWTKVNFAARPYLDAMQTMDSINDNYGADAGKSIVAYFLGNAGTWRGPVAKAVKKELNSRLKS